MAIGRPVTLTSNIAFKSVTATATAEQTSFTVTGGYNINKIAVFRNGVRLVDADDYEARDGASVTLLSPATLGDTLEFQIFDDFRVADAITDDGGTVNGDLSVAGVTTLTGAGVFVSGIVTANNFSIGSTTVINSARQLQNIASLDATTTATINSAVTGGGAFDDLNVTGVSTFVGVATFASTVGIAESIFHIGDTNTSFGFPAADTFTVDTGGTERLRINSDGDVGVGTETAETPRGNRGLEVAGTTGAEIVATRSDDNITDGDFIGGFVFKNLDAGGTPNHFAGMYAKANGTAGSMDLHFTGDRAQYEADTSDLTIRSGNIGIGTEVPAVQLEVFEDSGSGANIRLKNTEGFHELRSNNSEFRILEGTDERLRIDTDGNVGIGTDNPDSKLHIEGYPGETNLTLEGSSSGTGCFLLLKNKNTSINSSTIIQGLDGSGQGISEVKFTSSDDSNNEGFITLSTRPSAGSLTERVRVSSDGKVGIGTNSTDRTLDINGTVITNVADLGNVSGVTTLNFTNNNNFIVTLTGTQQFANPTGIATGQSGVIILKQDGTGSRTASYGIISNLKQEHHPHFPLVLVNQMPSHTTVLNLHT